MRKFPKQEKAKVNKYNFIKRGWSLVESNRAWIRGYEDMDKKVIEKAWEG